MQNIKNKKMAKRIRRIGRLSALLIVTAVLACFAAPAFAQTKGTKEVLKIETFERMNPVYSETVKLKTAKEDLSLPETLRAVISLEELGIDESDFVQAKPKASVSDGYTNYDYFYYGYVAAQNADELYANNEPAVYAIYYAEGEDSKKAETTAYRVYGSAGGLSDMWFACDESGNITGAVFDIPVTWEDEGYDFETEGEYIFNAVIAGYDSDAKPYAKITVRESNASDEGSGNTNESNAKKISAECTCEAGMDAESFEHAKDCPCYAEEELLCTCVLQTNEKNDEHDVACPCYLLKAEGCHCGTDGEAIDADNFPWAHQEDCIYFSPVECMCREKTKTVVEDFDEDGNKAGEHIEYVLGDFSHVHDPENTDCPLYGSEVETSSKVLYKSLGEIEIAPVSVKSAANYNLKTSLLSADNSGANEKRQNLLMMRKIKTSGNADYSSEYADVVIPGSWIDYVNTIWMNKAYKNFEWNTSGKAYNGWSWSGVTASETTGTVTDNPKRIPVKSGTIWKVYSGEQLKYALTNCSENDTVGLCGNIDLNGAVYSWDCVDIKGKNNFTLDGGGKTIYNFGSCAKNISTEEGYADRGFISNFKTATIRNITFDSLKIVAYGKKTGLFYNPQNLENSYITTVSDVRIENAFVCNLYNVEKWGAASVLGTLNGGNYGGNLNMSKVSRTVIDGAYVYGNDHVSGFASSVGGDLASSPGYSNVKYCYVVNLLGCATGGHSAAFNSCFGEKINFENCFASSEFYGSCLVSGFAGCQTKNISNCFSTGKIEGYSDISGFTHDKGESSCVYTNCYSTALCGMRTGGSQIGGFACFGNYDEMTGSAKYINCYAAGETGNYDVDMENPQNIGGFFNTVPLKKFTYSNCYYDKQTTAMREWTAGNKKNISGIRGVLTTDTVNSDEETVTGLTSSPGTAGFTGFSDNTQWKFASGHYPQLAAFADLNPFNWGNTISAITALRYSFVSTSTVMLDIWEEENEYTYDTVREIISPFSLTKSANYAHMAGSGAPSLLDGSAVTDTVVIDNENRTGKIENPGMDWYAVSMNAAKTIYRPIRLIGYMNIEAGNNVTVTSGETYDHKGDVRMSMIDTLTDNLVVGIDDDEIWSAGKTGGYPENKKYWAVPTTNMETGFSASKNALLYTEIWKAKQNADGSYVQDEPDEFGYTDGTDRLVPDLKVKLSGTGTGNNLTLDEQKWNGDLPMYSDSSAGHKYIILYRWKLADGRYVTDYKIITVTCGNYDITVNVRNMNMGDKTDALNSDSVFLGAAADDESQDLGYSLSETTAGSITAADIEYAKDSSAGWKVSGSKMIIVKTQIDLYAQDTGRTLMGTAFVNGTLKDGDIITVPTECFVLENEFDNEQQEYFEVTKQKTVNSEYTVSEKKDGNGKGTGEFYLRLARTANMPDAEITLWVTDGAVELPQTGGTGINIFVVCGIVLIGAGIILAVICCSKRKYG